MEECIIINVSWSMKQELFVDWSPDSRDHAALLRSMISDNTARGGPSGHRNVAIIARNADPRGSLQIPPGVVSQIPPPREAGHDDC